MAPGGWACHFGELAGYVILVSWLGMSFWSDGWACHFGELVGRVILVSWLGVSFECAWYIFWTND